MGNFLIKTNTDLEFYNCWTFCFEMSKKDKKVNVLLSVKHQQRGWNITSLIEDFPLANLFSFPSNQAPQSSFSDVYVLIMEMPFKAFTYINVHLKFGPSLFWWRSNDPSVGTGGPRSPLWDCGREFDWRRLMPCSSSRCPLFLCMVSPSSFSSPSFYRLKLK